MPLKKEIFFATGTQYYAANIKRLACANPDWRLTASQIISKGAAGEAIPRYSYISKPAKLVPEPKNPHDRHAVKVVIAGELVGYISSDEAVHVGEILRHCDIKYISAHITGGESKTVLSDGTIHCNNNDHVTIKIIIGYTEDNAMSQYNDYDDYDYDSTDYYDGYDEAPATRRSAPTRGRTPKKSIFKKWWFWLLILLVLGGISSAFGGNSAPADNAVSPSMDTSAPMDAADPEDALDFNVTFFNSFYNDSTGRWRKALVNTGTVIEDYALDYYNAYFESDDEVHYIYNFALGTENCLTVGSGTLFVTVREYVDGEEQDANTTGSGMVLGEYQITIDTGEVEKLS